MNRAIAAVDDRLGLATDRGIPWTIPADVDHYRATIASVDVLMGYGTYVELTRPLPDCTSYVATRSGSELREGFQPVSDLDAFLAGGHQGDLWIIGGAILYGASLAATDELHLTRVEGDFHCTKFFPPFEPLFVLVSDTPSPPLDGTPAIRFETWQRRTPAG